MAQNQNEAVDNPDTAETKPSLTLEQRLNILHHDPLYPLVRPSQPWTTRYFEKLAVLSTNEYAKPGFFEVSPRPTGYLYGVGVGAIFKLLDFFDPNQETRGVISIDCNPSVVLMGQCMLEMARQQASRDEMVAMFYGDTIKVSSSDEEVVRSSDDLLNLAETVIARFLQQGSSLFAAVLEEELRSGQFSQIADYLKVYRGNYDDHFTSGNFSDFINVPAYLYKNWLRIGQLVRDGKIALLHSDIDNWIVLNFLTSQIPDIATADNIIYCSNVHAFPGDNAIVRPTTDLSYLLCLNQSRRSRFVSRYIFSDDLYIADCPTEQFTQ